MFQTRFPTMSDSTQYSGINLEKNLEKMKSLNSSLEKTRLELSKFFMETQSEANFAKKLQKEVECKAQLEALEKLIAE